MSQWVRLWDDMPNDPKWRVVAARCGLPEGNVIAVFIYMMLNAGVSKERGSLENWCDEDVAAALGYRLEDVTAIRDAMQGKTLNGDYLTGWDKRQPLREDGSAERAKAWREVDKLRANASERKRTQRNASRTHPNAAEEKRIDKKDIDSSLRSESCSISKNDEIWNRSKKAQAEHFEFPEFYRVYPKRVGRKDASKKFLACVASGVEPSRIIEAAEKLAQAHLAAGTDKQFIPAPAVWLNQARYDDEDLPAPVSGHGRSNGTEGFVKWVLEDIENDKRRREESDHEIVPVLQLNGERYGKKN